MVEQGFVPAKNVEIVEEKAKKEISASEELTQTWRRIAEKRLEELITCQEELKREREVKGNKRDESMNKRIANIAVEVVKKVAPG